MFNGHLFEKVPPGAPVWKRADPDLVFRTVAAQARSAAIAQQMLADVRHVQQPAIAKMEKRADMYLSTLRSHIDAMGGQLEVVARFPDGVLKISNFSKLDQAALT